MNVLCRSLYSLRRAVSPAALPMVLTAVWAVVGCAQTPQPPYSLFEYSALTGSGNTITATQIPVVTAAGTTIYVNMTLQFDVDSNGNLTISSGYPQFVLAPTLLVSSFKAGKYVGPSTILGGKTTIVVAGPGVTDGGATEWSLSAASGSDNCTYPSSASWYVGPIASSPLSPRLKAAGITSTAWSYGTGSSQCNSGPGSGVWGSNVILGLSQIGNTITIASFSKLNGADFNTPQDQITYTLAP